MALQPVEWPRPQEAVAWALRDAGPPLASVKGVSGSATSHRFNNVPPSPSPPAGGDGPAGSGGGSDVPGGPVGFVARVTAAAAGGGAPASAPASSPPFRLEKCDGSRAPARQPGAVMLGVAAVVQAGGGAPQNRVRRAGARGRRGGAALE